MKRHLRLICTYLVTIITLGSCIGTTSAPMYADEYATPERITTNLPFGVEGYSYIYKQSVSYDKNVKNFTCTLSKLGTTYSFAYTFGMTYTGTDTKVHYVYFNTQTNKYTSTNAPQDVSLPYQSNNHDLVSKKINTSDLLKCDPTIVNSTNMSVFAIVKLGDRGGIISNYGSIALNVLEQYV